MFKGDQELFLEFALAYKLGKTVEEIRAMPLDEFCGWPIFLSMIGDDLYKSKGEAILEQVLASLPKILEAIKGA